MRFGYVLLGLVTLLSVNVSSGQSTCANGLAGVQNGDICCAESCGTCGGSGCGGRNGGSSSCCVGTITSGGMLCSATGMAPCIIDPVEMCTNGFPGVQNGDICCDLDCGECGGGGCAGRTGGADNCCTSRINENDIMCMDAMEAPCIIENDSVCEGGVPGVQNNDNICCAASCGTCGGGGCARRPGGADNCCSSRIRESMVMCSTTMEGPCILDGVSPPTPAPTEMPTPMPTPAPTEMPTPTPTDAPVVMCDNGFPGVQQGTICCEAQCGTCGGAGCGGRPGGQDSCCTGPIASSGDICSVTMMAPCRIDT